jgi:hypothetical protein
MSPKMAITVQPGNPWLLRVVGNVVRVAQDYGTSWIIELFVHDGALIGVGAAATLAYG